MAAPDAQDAKAVRERIGGLKYASEKAAQETVRAAQAVRDEQIRLTNEAEAQQQATQQENARAKQLIAELPGTWSNSCLRSSGNGWPENPVEVRVNGEVLEWRASDGSKGRFAIWPTAASGFQELYYYDSDTGLLTFKNEYRESTFKVLSRDYMVQEETSFIHAWNPRKCDWRRTN